MKLSICIVVGILFCVGCVDSPSFSDTKPAVMPRGFWKSSPQKAAVDYARENLDEKNRGEITVKKDAQSLTNGMIEYGGHSNVYGMSNQLVRFGKRADVRKISFSYGFMRRGNFVREYEKQSKCYSGLNYSYEKVSKTASYKRFSRTDRPC